MQTWSDVLGKEKQQEYFQETIQALKEIGYDGALALETNCEPDTRTCARKSLEYLKRILGE